jgi:hypothetical protein
MTSTVSNESSLASSRENTRRAKAYGGLSEISHVFYLFLPQNKLTEDNDKRRYIGVLNLRQVDGVMGDVS